MENKDQEHNSKDAKTEVASPYQQLYGKKDKASKEKGLKDAGAFGSAAKSPGPESASSKVKKK